MVSSRSRNRYRSKGHRISARTSNRLATKDPHGRSYSRVLRMHCNGFGVGVIAYEMTCKCNGHPRRVWFFRALPSEILVGWLVDGERRGRRICRRKIYIPRPRFLHRLTRYSVTCIKHANRKYFVPNFEQCTIHYCLKN